MRNWKGTVGSHDRALNIRKLKSYRPRSGCTNSCPLARITSVTRLFERDINRASPHLFFHGELYPMIRLTLCTAVLFLLGCGGGGSSVPYTDHSRDPEAFAKTTKQMIFDVIDDARNSREPAESLEAIVDKFEGRFDQLPVGDYRPIYEEIHALATELYEACEAIDGPTPDLNARLAEMQTMAEKLPGDAQMGR